MDEFEGFFDVLFAHQPSPIRAELKGAMRDTRGHIIYLISVDGIIYNWANVIYMRRIEL